MSPQTLFSGCNLWTALRTSWLYTDHDHLLTSTIWGSLTSDVITITIGSFEGDTRPQMFHIHRDVLKGSSSELLKEITKPGTRYPGTKTASLSKHEPRVFAAYSQWLYTGNLAPNTLASDWNIVESYLLGQGVGILFRCRNDPQSNLISVEGSGVPESSRPTRHRMVPRAR